MIYYIRGRKRNMMVGGSSPPTMKTANFNITIVEDNYSKQIYDTRSNRVSVEVNGKLKVSWGKKSWIMIRLGRCDPKRIYECSKRNSYKFEFNDDQGKTDYVIDFDFKSDFNKLKCIFAYWDIFFAKSKKTKIS